MKRFLTIIVAVCAFLAASAQHPMVTLSHDGELSFFTNLNALVEAVDSAQNGDTLYLSEGDFVIAGGALTLTKRLSIKGSGYGSHILGNIKIDMFSNFTYLEAPLFDGVRLDGLDFSTTGLAPGDNRESWQCLGKSEIRNTWIRILRNGAHAGKEVTIDKCYIEDANFSGTNKGEVVVKNSKLRGSTSANDCFHLITAINCNLASQFRYPRTTLSSIFTHIPGSNLIVEGEGCSIINSLVDFALPSNTSLYSSGCYLHNSDEGGVLLDENLDCPVDLQRFGYLGMDGTVVGIMGGETPYTENPSVPTVDTAKSSVTYDAEGNKLKVNITVKAD